MDGRSALRRVGRALLITLILVWSAFPIYWALNTSFTTLNGAQSVPAHFLPSPFTAHNYRTLLNQTSGGVGNQFWRSFVNRAGVTLHVRLLSGEDPHHIIEAVFKGVARALAVACERHGPDDAVPSTKGTL